MGGMGGLSLSGVGPPTPAPGLGPAAFVPASFLGSRGRRVEKETPGQLAPGPETALATD